MYSPRQARHKMRRFEAMVPKRVNRVGEGGGRAGSHLTAVAKRLQLYFGEARVRFDARDSNMLLRLF